MKITINNKEFKLKYTLRALFVFEELTNKPFELVTLTDQYIFLYSMLIANNPEEELTFEQLIDYVDENPTIMIQFMDFLTSELKKRNQFVNETKHVDNKKKF